MLDGANKIKPLAEALGKMGIKSCAITDHGNMFGAIDFYKTMKSKGIKPIIGMEAYIHNAPDISDKESKQRFHLCLFAKNQKGYENLMYLSSMAYTKGFYYFPRINKNELFSHSEGLVCSAACLAGEVNFHLNLSERNLKRGAGGYEAAKRVVKEYQEVFGEDYYLEIMRHGLGDQRKIDDQILRLSKETGVKLIATNDAHYLKKETANAQKVFIYISANKNFDESTKKQVLSQFYTKSPEEMSEIFADLPEIVSNTQEIVEKCNLELNLGNPTPPNYKFSLEEAASLGLNLPFPNERYNLANDIVLFEYRARAGLKKRLLNVPTEKHEAYKARLEREIETINKMKFPGYMLIVADFINWAKQNGIAVGPGRGSAAGSIVSYSLFITDLDPIPYDLLFERFLNPERISMPDIDVDFCQERRGEVIEYVTQKYGKDNVAQVATFGKLLAKGVILDVGRVLGMPLQDTIAMNKLIPDELGITLREHKSKTGDEMVPGAWELEPKLRELVASNPLAQQVWNYACELEGLNRNTGKHAAGVVISNEELWKKSPIFVDKNGDYVTQYSKDFLEDVDLIKFDFLGLKTLDVIDKTLKQIERRHGEKLDWEKVGFCDAKTYESIQTGNTLGIFQIESAGMMALAANLKPDCFEDLIAMIALYRPGPMDLLPDFIDIKHGKKEMVFAFKEIEPILKPTYGIIVYQEQVMQLVQTVGGFSLGGADLVRRAMGKKKVDEMARLKQEYLDGAKKRGFDAAKADHLFEQIMEFAKYGFNKSHAAAYAMITYQTAYLKTHYPAEFMAALVSTESKNIDKVGVYVEEMARLGIEFKRPSINDSVADFGVVGNSILYGFSAIKGVGEAAVENILKVREESGKFESLEDLISRTEGFAVNKKVYESLIKSGALDDFGLSRKKMLANIDNISESARRVSDIKRNIDDSLFGDDADMTKARLELLDVRGEFSKRELLKFEMETLGAYISGHPLDDYKSEIEALDYTLSDKFSECEDGSEVLSIGKIEGSESKLTKSGKKMGVVKILDFAGSFEAMTFEVMSRIEGMTPTELNEPYAFKLNLSKDGDSVKLRLLDMGSLLEVKNGTFSVRASKWQPSQSEISVLSTLGSKRRFVKELNATGGETLVVGVITNAQFKTSKAGKDMVFLNVIDESGGVEFLGFSEAIEFLGNVGAWEERVFGFRIGLARESGQKHIINEILEFERVASGDFTLRRGGGVAKSGGFGGGFGGGGSGANSRSGGFGGGTEKVVANLPQLPNLQVEFLLDELDSHRIEKLYNLARATHNEGYGTHMLSIKVKDAQKSYVYGTEFKVGADFEARAREFLR